MSRREKIAWFSMIGMIVAYGPYFMFVANNPAMQNGLPNLPLLLIFGVTTAVHASIVLGGYLWLWTQTGEEARQPPDERDAAIFQRSMQVSYFVMMAGLLWVGAVMPFSTGGWEIVNSAIAVVIIAELSRDAYMIATYRLGAA